MRGKEEERRHSIPGASAEAEPGFVGEFSGLRGGFTRCHMFFEKGVVRFMEILPNGNYCY